MDDAMTVALVGVASTVGVASISQIAAWKVSGRSRAWQIDDAERSYKHERQTTVLEHRREVYDDFLREYILCRNRVWAFTRGASEEGEFGPDRRALKALSLASARVGIYGAEDAYRLANMVAQTLDDAVDNIQQRGVVNQMERDMVASTDPMVSEFRLVCRRDLGTDEPQ